MSLSVTALLHAVVEAAPAVTVLVDGTPTSLAEVERASRTATSGLLGDLAAARCGRPLGAGPAADVAAAETTVWSETPLVDGWTHGDLLSALGGRVPARLAPLADLVADLSLAGGWPAAVDVRRGEDDELVGRLVPGAGGWTPVTLLGTRLGPPQPADDARYDVLAAGLSWLADPWELWLDGAWVAVSVGEVTPTAVRVRLADFGRPDRYGETLTLDLPVGASLRPR